MRAVPFKKKPDYLMRSAYNEGFIELRHPYRDTDLQKIIGLPDNIDMDRYFISVIGSYQIFNIVRVFGSEYAFITFYKKPAIVYELIRDEILDGLPMDIPRYLKKIRKQSEILKKFEPKEISDVLVRMRKNGILMRERENPNVPYRWIRIK